MGINEFIKIGNKIKELRISKGISQKDMAAQLGINRSTYSNYENDIREPNLDVIKKVADALSVDISELLSTDHIYNDITNNADKYCTDITYSANYPIEKSQELINLYFKGVTCWINDSLFSQDEKRVLNEHFCEVLTRYKTLIEAMLDSKLSYKSNEQNIQQYAKTLSTELTQEQLKALYFGNNVDKKMNDLASYIQFLPIMFSNTDKKEGE